MGDDHRGHACRCGSARLVAAATELGRAVTGVVCEIGSGMNGHRRKLTRLLSDAAATVIVVESRDRLTRFGFEHLEAAPGSAGRRVVVVDNAESGDDLVGEVSEVLTPLCARRYGHRWASRRAATASGVLTGTQQR